MSGSRLRCVVTVERLSALYTLVLGLFFFCVGYGKAAPFETCPMIFQCNFLFFFLRILRYYIVNVGLEHSSIFIQNVHFYETDCLSVKSQIDSNENWMRHRHIQCKHK